MESEESVMERKLTAIVRKYLAQKDSLEEEITGLSKSMDRITDYNRYLQTIERLDKLKERVHIIESICCDLSELLQQGSRDQ